MLTTITSGIESTESIQRHIFDNLDEVEGMVPDDAHVTVRIKKQAAGLFQAVFHMRVLHRDIVTSVTDTNLYRAISQARRRMKSQIAHALDRVHNENRRRDRRWMKRAAI